MLQPDPWAKHKSPSALITRVLPRPCTASTTYQRTSRLVLPQKLQVHTVLESKPSDGPCVTPIPTEPRTEPACGDWWRPSGTPGTKLAANAESMSARGKPPWSPSASASPSSEEAASKSSAAAAERAGVGTSCSSSKSALCKASGDCISPRRWAAPTPQRCWNPYTTF